jgi:hypothetical protein
MENTMNAHEANYFDAYRSLKLTRDAIGVLVAEFHTKGGPFTFTAQDHTELVDAFYRIAQDRENKIVILTGAGGDFKLKSQCSGRERWAVFSTPGFL